MRVNDLSSALFNSFLGIGQIAGPIFGSSMVHLTSFRTCCDWVAIISLVFSLLYYMCADGFGAFRSSSCKPIGITVEDDANELTTILKCEPNVSLMPMHPRLDTQFSAVIKQRILKLKSSKYAMQQLHSFVLERQASGMHLDMDLKKKFSKLE